MIVLRHPRGRCVKVVAAKDSHLPRTSPHLTEGHGPFSESMIQKLLHATSL